MSVLIRGMEMPIEKSSIIQIFPNGTVRRLDVRIFNSHFEAVPVPSHGRLIDADAIRAGIYEKRPGRSYEDAWALTIMDAAPTILEAEEGET